MKVRLEKVNKNSKRENAVTEKKPEDKEQKEETSGITQETLRGLGKIIPGLGGLIKGLEKSEAFQERLKATDAAIEHKVKSASPLKREKVPGRSIIPPKTTLKESQTTFREKTPEPPQREVSADIFDEGEYLKVIAEVPGLDEKNIQAEVKDNQLILNAQAPHRHYYEKIELPCAVKRELNVTYKNGILQIIIEKMPTES